MMKRSGVIAIFGTASLLSMCDSFQRFDNESDIHRKS